MQNQDLQNQELSHARVALEVPFLKVFCIFENTT